MSLSDRSAAPAGARNPGAAPESADRALDEWYPLSMGQMFAAQAVVQLAVRQLFRGATVADVRVQRLRGGLEAQMVMQVCARVRSGGGPVRRLVVVAKQLDGWSLRERRIYAALARSSYC